MFLGFPLLLQEISKQLFDFFSFAQFTLFTHF